jgi:hypothetical protein
MLDRYHEIRLFDTANLTETGRPTPGVTVGFLLRIPTVQLLHSSQPDARLNDEIQRILPPSERNRLLGGHPYIAYERCCSLCGGSLGLRECGGCKRKYRDDEFSSTVGITIPPKIRAHLVANGHRFE